MNKVLFVDDDKNLLDGYKRRLRKQFDIVTALGAEEGLDTIKTKGPFEVIVSDLRMPVMDGFEFLARAKKISPESVCMVLTSHTDLQESMKAVNEENIFRFLTKPCKTHLMVKAISAGIKQYIKNSQMASEKKPLENIKSPKKILIVDDDPETLTIISTALKDQDKLYVLTAENGSVAAKLLNIIKIDVAIIDKEMPVMNGIKLMNHIYEKYPEIQTFMMTWHMTTKFEKEIHALGCSGYFLKPPDIDSLTNRIIEEIQSGTIAKIDGISVAACMQMIEAEEKTCTIKITSDNKTGFIYFLKGNLISAKADDIRNEKAAYEIINWERPVIEIEDTLEFQKKEINKPLMWILMEAAKIRDHKAFKDKSAV
ncbi:MAG: response regulator [Desulfobacterales bacterium]|jgi:DNA-binding NtrC family response regulator|nr:response regulator [Desulfobacteraceae bacterium]MBT4363082.1 response regulator [Desulfobacteraceae bacterium]MBT7084707.1 response regulator [Desulfobacterales bacterium]MBT7697467.1 response regulator [Desulfobacterales bacterium]